MNDVQCLKLEHSLEPELKKKSRYMKTLNNFYVEGLVAVKEFWACGFSEGRLGE